MNYKRDLMMVKLNLIVADQSKDKRITGPGEHPPCFESLKQYTKWQEAAEKMDGSPPPGMKTGAFSPAQSSLRSAKKMS